jgi:hypothetical protein
MWAIIVFLTFQFLLGGGPTKGPTGSTVTPCLVQLPDLYEASISELQDGLEHGHFTSVDLVKVPPRPTILH